MTEKKMNFYGAYDETTPLAQNESLQTLLKLFHQFSIRLPKIRTLIVVPSTRIQDGHRFT